MAQAFDEDLLGEGAPGVDDRADHCQHRDAQLLVARADPLGPERTEERGYIFNTLVESGAVPTNGTDPPVDEISPVGSYYCSVTRILPDGSKFQADEAYSRELALYSYTMGNAIAAFEEDIKGSLSVGKLADITVLSQDLLTVPDNKIMETEIVMTIVGGKIRYRNNEIVY